MPGPANRPRSSHATSLLSPACRAHTNQRVLVQAHRAAADALLSALVRDRDGDFRIRCNHRSVLDGAIHRRRSGRRFALRRTHHPPFLLFLFPNFNVEGSDAQVLDNRRFGGAGRGRCRAGAFTFVGNRDEQRWEGPASGERGQNEGRKRHSGESWMIKDCSFGYSPM